MDPRATVVEERLAGVGRVVAVTGSKGGTGKSVVASTLALSLADRGVRVGLFDLDFTSPSDHLILGVDRRFPAERFGIEPHLAHGVHLMSVAFFAGDAPAPLRGSDTTSALLELLAVTRWGELDVLLLDMPPGLGDTGLDVIRLLPRLELLLVGTASRVVIGSVRRAIRLFAELEVPMIGVIENMRRNGGPAVSDMASGYSVPFLGSLPFDPSLEPALGAAESLRATVLFRELVPVVERTGLAG